MGGGSADCAGGVGVSRRENDAFLRAVLAAPDDVLPRLVYADWLEERGDPRGPYLRLEVEAIRGGDFATARAAARSLAPLWVARVSRPPLGVLCAQLIKSDIGRPVTPAILKAIEGELDVKLPPQLRAVLLNCNPNSLRAGPFLLPETEFHEATFIRQFASNDDPDHDPGYLDGDTINRAYDLRERLGDYDLPTHFLYLADDDRSVEFLVSTAPRLRGTVWLFREHLVEEGTDPDNALVRYADSVGDFLHRLQPRTYPLPEGPPH